MSPSVSQTLPDKGLWPFSDGPALTLGQPLNEPQFHLWIKYTEP